MTSAPGLALATSGIVGLCYIPVLLAQLWHWAQLQMSTLGLVGTLSSFSGVRCNLSPSNFIFYLLHRPQSFSSLSNASCSLFDKINGM